MLCLGCQLVLKLSIVAWFEINQEYIAATLCENRNKPELVCCGKCVLTKQLKKADDVTQKGQQNVPSKEERSSTVVFVLPDNTHLNIPYQEVAEAVQHPRQSNHNGIIIEQSIFHPPSFIYS